MTTVSYQLQTTDKTDTDIANANLVNKVNGNIPIPKSMKKRQLVMMTFV